MRSKKQTTNDRRDRATFGKSRRQFLKQTVALAAVTAGYSVISLTQLGCHDAVPTEYTPTTTGYDHHLYY